MDLLDIRYGVNAKLPAVRQDGTLYFVTDTRKIYRGNVEYTGNVDNITLTIDSADNRKHTLSVTFKDGSQAIGTSTLSATAIDAILNVLDGQGNANTKGLVKLSSAINSALGVSAGVAATPQAVKLALDAAKEYTDKEISANMIIGEAMIYKGAVGTASRPSLPFIDYKAGWTYKVAAPGDYLGNGTTQEVGDMIIAEVDGPSTGDAVRAEDWTIVQTDLEGAVVADQEFTTDALILAAGPRALKSIASVANKMLKTDNSGKITWGDLPTDVDEKVKQSPLAVSAGTYNLLLKNSANTNAETSGTNFKEGLMYNVGTNTISAAAESAHKLTNPRTLKVNLAGSATPTFDGSADVTMGVTGTLPLAKGGTGATTAATARQNLELGGAALLGVADAIVNSGNLITASAVFNALRWKTFDEA